MADPHQPNPRGERHHRARLTEWDVERIRKMAGEGWTYQHIATMFAISRGHACKIASKKAWRHVQ